MRKRLLIFLAFFITLLMIACVTGGAYSLLLKTLLRHSVPEITVQEAAGQQKDLVFLDARSPDEYAVSHLAQARYVGYETFDLQSVADLPTDTPVVVYCAIGYRSEKISEKMIAAGFTKVSNLYGGIFEWVNQGLPVYNEQGETEEVHAYNQKWGIWVKRGKKRY